MSTKLQFPTGLTELLCSRDLKTICNPMSDSLNSPESFEPGMSELHHLRFRRQFPYFQEHSYCCSTGREVSLQLPGRIVQFLALLCERRKRLLHANKCSFGFFNTSRCSHSGLWASSR